MFSMDRKKNGMNFWKIIPFPEKAPDAADYAISERHDTILIQNRGKD